MLEGKKCLVILYFRVLHERCQSLMRKYDKESRANKRLSMECEELMYKLTESFNESDLGAQEALFYQKLGMSPSGGELNSPLMGRKLRTPSSSENSPCKSPGYRRTLSSSVDDREEKKLKRRSGNYLLDEKKQQQQRPKSPLTQDNALTRSWSPSTQSSSPTRNSSRRSANKMSQSWCVDMGDKSPTPEPETNHGDNSDSDKGFVSTNESCNSTSEGFNDSGDLSESLKSNGVSDSTDSFPASSTPRSGRETVTLSEANNVFTDDDDIKSLENLSSPEQKSSESSTSANVEDHVNKVSPKSEKVSKLPVLTEVKDSPPKRGHTETTV